MTSPFSPLLTCRYLRCSVVDPLTATEVDHPDGFTQIECAYEHGGQIGLLNVFYKVAIIGYGCNISWQARNFNPKVAESKFIMIGMYQLALLGLIAGAIMAMGVSASVNVMVQCFASVIGSVSLVFCLLLPKMQHKDMTKEDIMKAAQSTETSIHHTTSKISPTTTSRDADKEVEQLKKEVKRLQVRGLGEQRGAMRRADKITMGNYTAIIFIPRPNSFRNSQEQLNLTRRE